MRKFLLIFILSITIYSTKAQFYNGMQMTFGKNRVQYKDFYWNYYRYQPFDIYFNIGGHELSKYTAKIAFEELSNIQNLFSYNLSKRIIFIVYNRMSDFRQSNMGLVTGSEQYNTGGVTRVLNNKVFVYYEGDHILFRRQIRAAIADVLVNEIFYGGSFRNKVTNSTLLNLPNWFVDGLVDFVSYDWDSKIENQVRDGIINGKFKYFNRLTGEDAKIAGHSFWHFVALRYGTSVITDILYLTKIYKNSESGFLGATGLNLKDIVAEWYKYYQSTFTEDIEGKNDFSGQKLFKRSKKNTKYQNIALSYDGRYIAFNTNKQGKYKIFIYDNKTQKIKKIFKKGESLEQITDYSYPFMRWNPNNKILAFMTEIKGKNQLFFYNTETKELKNRQMLYYDKILDFDYSPNGLKMVLSAVQKGHTDIYLFDLPSGTSQNITEDYADDLHPSFSTDGKKIIFQSNRTNIHLSCDSIKQDFDVFVFNTQRNDSLLEQLSDFKHSNEVLPKTIAPNKYLFLSDKIGISNLYKSSFDSTISFIDTTAHYRFFNTSTQLTDYNNSILDYDFDSQNENIIHTYLYKGKYYISKTPIDLNNRIKNPKEVAYKSIENKQKAYRDSILKLQEAYLAKLKKVREIEKARVDSLKKIKSADTTVINIENYQLDIANQIDTVTSHLKKKRKKISNIAKRKMLMNYYDPDSLPDRRVYQTSFYVNNIVNQVDFGFLSASYQSFTGGAVYFNPGMNALTKIGANELFENYKLVGGARFSGNFDSNEYLLSLENLKDRTDKQYIFHRQVFQTQDGNYLRKVRSHELMYVLRYPFDQVSALKFTTGLRNDFSTMLTFDYNSLIEPSSMKTFATTKLEYIFDNSISRGVNLYEGMRGKAWFEAYKQLDGAKTDLFVGGFDFRSYINIFRSLTWANRLAGSKSFGHSRLMYYLGGVDNWVNLSLTKPIFNDTSEVRINNDITWTYQALATNMRGFIQNARNGDTFVLLNSELRLPLFRFLADHPLNSDLLNTFQIVGFFDAGSAWTGLSPLDNQNYYLNKIINRNSITVIVDMQRSPVIMGYGFGFRARLFGYYFRTDWAWGIDNKMILPRVFYLSLTTDF